MRFKAIAIVSGMSVASAASAGMLSAASGDVAFGGGATAGYFYNNKTGSTNIDGVEVPDIALNFSSDAKTRGVGFNIATGRSMTPSIFGTSPTSVGGAVLQTPPESFQIFVADFSVVPVANLTLDVGKLPTNIGYEIAPTFANPNVLLGAVWFSQPITYPGMRATYNFGPAQVYVETNKDTSTGGSGATVVGAMGTLGGMNLTASYYDAYKGRNIIDVIASYAMGNTTFAANVDYHTLDSEVKEAGKSSSAAGVALYVIPKMGKISLPVRVEYLRDGTSGVYGGVDTGYTATVTPTYALSDNAFVRAELAYLSSKNKLGSLADKSGVTTDSRMAASVSLGVKF